MDKYFLNNYTLSNRQLLQSVILSEYGLRHWTQSNEEPQYKWGHRFLAILELCPFIGLIVTIMEATIARYNTPRVQWLVRGSQNGCSGDILAETSRKIVEALHGKVDGIDFDATQIGTYVAGGTCTAMSLAFLESYFKETNHSQPCITRLIEVGKKFQTSSLEMRNRQAAYNTICVKPGTENALQKKVQALAHHLGFKMVYASKEVDCTLQNVSSITNNLPQGAFLIRMIKPSQNTKLEELGHSLIYIKNKDSHFLYDPNQGLKQLSRQNHSEELYHELQSCANSFLTDKLGFHQFTYET